MKRIKTIMNNKIVKCCDCGKEVFGFRKYNDGSYEAYTYVLKKDKIEESIIEGFEEYMIDNLICDDCDIPRKRDGTPKCIGKCDLLEVCHKNCETKDDCYNLTNNSWCNEFSSEYFSEDND